ncbi:kinase-like protein, partial [Trametes cingulata]
LQALARLNIVHHDIKTTNILIDPKGHALLSDFGLSKIVDPGTYEEWRGYTRAGTAAYMAPEMVVPDHSTIGHDAKVDVWSLG